MDKYIIITTLCNKEDIANKIIETLLEKKLVAGSQLYKVQSRYWWNLRQPLLAPKWKELF